VVYILRLVSVYVSVDVAVGAQLADTFAVGSSHPPHCFLASNSFAGVFGYVAVFRKADCCETTQAVEWRFLDGQPARLLPFFKDESVICSVDGIQGLRHRF
jgi:hypothetical protein